MKTMLIMFFDICGTVHRDFVPGLDSQHKALLRSSAVFEGEHSANATTSVACEELDSPQ
jgi:hypothetical protein